MSNVARGAAGLALFVRAGGFVFALDASQVERILLADQVEAEVRRPGGAASRIQVGTRWYAARSLAELFGSTATPSALVLVRLPDGVDVALQVTACVKVAPPPALTAVPAALVRRGGAGIRGAFATQAALGAGAGAPFGLMVDVGAALGAADQAAIRDELRSAALDEWSEA